MLEDKLGHTFAAIVSKQLGLVAELDILILWPEPPGRIVQRGDIDNRLKTLFDALCAPSNLNQVPDNLTTSPTNPQYVLLSDDELITRVNVETDRLLGAGGDAVRVYVRVTTRTAKPMWINLSL